MGYRTLKYLLKLNFLSRLYILYIVDIKGLPSFIFRRVYIISHLGYLSIVYLALTCISVTYIYKNITVTFEARKFDY